MIFSDTVKQSTPFNVTLSFSDKGRAYQVEHINHGLKFATETYINGIADLLQESLVPNVVICDDGYYTTSYFSRSLNKFKLQSRNLHYAGNSSNHPLSQSRSVAYYKSMFRHFFLFMPFLTNLGFLRVDFDIINYLNDAAPNERVSACVFDGMPMDMIYRIVTECVRNSRVYKVNVIDRVDMSGESDPLLHGKYFHAINEHDKRASLTFKDYTQNDFVTLSGRLPYVRFNPVAYQKYNDFFGERKGTAFLRTHLFSSNPGSVHIDLYNRSMRKAYLDFDGPSLPLPMRFGKGVDVEKFFENYYQLFS